MKNPLLSFGSVILLAVPGSLMAAGGDAGHHVPDHVPFSVYFHAVNLLILIGLLVFFLRKPLRDFLVKRQDSVREALMSAKRAQEAAEAKAAELQMRLNELEQEAESRKVQQEKDAKDEAARLIEHAKVRATAIEAQFEQTLQDELRRVRTKLRTEAVNMALELATELVKKGISGDDHGRLYGEYVTHLNKTEVN